MEPLTIIAVAKGLASLTGLDTWINEKLGGVLGENAAKKISDIAQQVTGATSPNEARLALERSAEQREAFRAAMVANEHDLALAALQDVHSARQMYAVKNDMADKVAYQVITWNHWAAFLLLAVNALVLKYIDDKITAVALGNLIGASVAALWTERQQVIGFFFGSSLGSKMKTAIGSKH